ncbi:syntaxin-11-like [Spinachia spinachia]
MRDRLSHLHQVQTDSEGFSVVQLDHLSEHAAAAHPDEDLDSVLQEAWQIRLDIRQIEKDVSELKDVNYRSLTRTTHLPASEQDSNAIGMDVKRRGEAVLQRLHTMNTLRGELEAQRGTFDPAARVARTQHRFLSGALREAMGSYNDAEVSHREACKRHIRRQMEVMDREVSAQEVEEMMVSGELHVFGAQAIGKTARAALLQIQGRQEELLELEKRIQGIRELFLDVAVLTEEHGLAADNIQKSVQTTQVVAQGAVVRLDRARTFPKKHLLCCHLPCFYS